MKITKDHVVYSVCAILALAGIVFIYLGLTQGSHAAAATNSSVSRQMGMMVRTIR